MMPLLTSSYPQMATVDGNYVRPKVIFTKIDLNPLETVSEPVSKQPKGPAWGAPLSKTPAVSFKEILSEQEPQKKFYSSQAVNTPKNKKTPKKAPKKDITHIFVKSTETSTPIDYSEKDLISALQSKNKKLIQRIISRPLLYTETSDAKYLCNHNTTKDLFNTYFNTAFDILGDDFGLYLSCKPDKKPLNAFAITNRKQDSSSFSWIYTKYNTLYPIYGFHPTQEQIQETLEICASKDAPEFIKTVKKDVNINWNRIFETCLKHKSTRTFQEILEFLSRKQMQRFISNVECKNSGNIVLQYRLDKIQPNENFNWMVSVNNLDICDALIQSNECTEINICTLAIECYSNTFHVYTTQGQLEQRERSQLVIKKYFRPEFYFKIPKETIRYYTAKPLTYFEINYAPNCETIDTLIRELQPYFFTPVFEHADILFREFCKLFETRRNLPQHAEDFLQHCVYYTGCEVDCYKCKNVAIFNHTRYCTCNYVFKRTHMQIIETCQSRREADLCKIIYNCLTEINVCDDIINSCIIPTLYYVPKKVKKSIYDTDE